MRVFLLVSFIGSSLSLLSQAQKREDTEKKLYAAQIKAAESLLRLNETGEARKMLDEADPSRRGFEWQVLNALTDRSVQTYKGHEKPVVGIAISPDGRLLASGSADSSIIIREVSSGRQQARLTGHRGQVTSLDFSPDGNQLLSGSTDRTLKLWDVAGRKEITTFQKNFFRGIYQCKFSPDGKSAGVVSWEFIPGQSPPVQGFAVVMSVPDGNIVRRFNTDNHPAASIDFSGDGRKIYTATWGFYVKQHDIESGKDEWQYDLSEIGYYAAFQSCDLAPDGKRIVAGGKDNQVRMLDASDGKLLYVIQPHKGHSKWVNAVRFSPDGNLFASASDDQLVKVWETTTGKHLYTFTGHTGNINGLAFAPDNTTLYSSSNDGTIKKWDLSRPGKQSFYVTKSGPWCAPVTPDGKWMAAANSDSAMNIWNLETMTIAQSYPGISAIAAVFSPDGKHLASANDKLNVFDLQAKKMITSATGHKSRITGIDWMQQMNYIATASGDGTVRIWNEKGDSIAMINGRTGTPYALAFSPGGRRLIVGMTNGKVKVYNTATWLETDSVQLGASLLSLRLDPTGRYVVTGGDKGEAWIWDLEKNEKTELAGHTNIVYAVGFHPRLPYAVTACYDLSVKIWSLKTGQCVLTLKDFTKELYTVTITKGGERMVVTETEGLVHIYDLK